MRYLQQIPAWLRSKYTLTFLAFVVWITFLDERDIITTHFRHTAELHRLEDAKKQYEARIKATRAELDQLRSNPATVEKYARERYFMKRDNEDVFIVK